MTSKNTKNSELEKEWNKLVKTPSTELGKYTFGKYDPNKDPANFDEQEIKDMGFDKLFDK